MSDQDLASIDGELTLRHALTRLTATWRRRVALGLVLAVPLALALAGGFAPAPQRTLPSVAPGQVVPLGPFEVALEEFFVSDQVNTRALPEHADAWLGVIATVTGTDDQATSLHRYALTFPESLIAADGDLMTNPSHNDIKRIDDGASMYHFPPGLTVQVVTLLPVADAGQVPGQITVELTELESAWSFLMESHTWYERERVGHVTLSRTEAIPPQLVEEEQ